MFDTILIPAGESESAKRAAAFGRKIAEYYDARIDILHVFESGSRIRNRSQVEEKKERGREILDEISKIACNGDVDCDTHLVEGQSPTSIAEHIDENDIDLVVMGRRDRSGFGEHLLGTITDRVLRRTNTPVATVAAEVAATDAYDDILLTTDGSENAERALPYGVSITQHVDGTLHLLNVADVQAQAGVFDAGGVTTEFIERLEADGQTAVERLARHIDDPAITVESSVVRGTSHTAISEYITESGIDLLVIASEGKSNLASQTLGSVTDHVLQTVDIPVLVVVT
ncbi:universal stress protein [Halocatena pleomorpha]|uniref:Universal stress protein n=1 Tax=Halocatena pleomorpha TaxID=1785090 RepID=A0A3P3REL5_9EURY|nr:universal stress protein [Halocatena pleomorpha]RRJ31835.1 universal stress protein [Halocatena pleomorpha]